MSDPDATHTHGSRILPTLGMVVTVGALFAASTVLGWPTGMPTSGVNAWLPHDGQRSLFASPGSDHLSYAEWTRSDPTILLVSDILPLWYWATSAEVDFFKTNYLQARIIEVGPDGVTTALSDTLWTIEDDGLLAHIEYTIPGEIDIMFPGRLDLPPDLEEGSTWTSTGIVHRWGDSDGSMAELPYQATYQTTLPSDVEEAERGCLDVAMDYAVDGIHRLDSHSWCPQAGFSRFTRDSVIWRGAAVPLPGKLNPEEPFDWSTADTLEFTVREEEPADSYLQAPLAPPGLTEDGAIFTSQLPPNVLGVITSEEPVDLAWVARPGGTPTAVSTLGGITIVATTNRQLVAYNSVGRWVWEAERENLTVTAPVRFGDQVVVSTLEGGVTSFDLRTGTTVWSADLGAPIRVTPVVAGNRLLVANQDGTLACFDPTGEQLWVVDAGVPRSIAVSRGPEPVVVFGGSDSAVLTAYALADGSQLWRQRVREDARDLISLDHVVVLRDNDRCMGIDWSTGEVVWQWTTTSTFAGVGGGNRLLLLTADDLLLLDETGNQIRTWPHHLVGVATGTTWLVASGETVMAWAPKKVEIGTQP